MDSIDGHHSAEKRFSSSLKVLHQAKLASLVRKLQVTIPPEARQRTDRPGRVLKTTKMRKKLFKNSRSMVLDAIVESLRPASRLTDVV